MASSLSFLDHGGEMAVRIRAHDWSENPMGPPEAWPEPLRFALGIALGSSFPMAIYWGPQLRLLYNDAWAPIPADRHPWALGRPGAEVWPEIWDVVGPQMQRVIETGEGFAAWDQLLMIARQGHARESWWNYSLTPIRDAAGQVVGVLNQGNETTRLVVAERARAAEVDRLREMFHQAPGAVAVLHGADHVIEVANPPYLELVGRDDIIGKPMARALPEVAEQGFVDLLDQVYRSGEAFAATSRPVLLQRVRGEKPELRILDFVYQPIKDASGATTDIFVQATDVTERARAEEALRQSEERLQLALDATVGIGTWDWDVPRDRVTGDARFARLYGIDPVELQRGEPASVFFDFIHPHDRERVAAAVRHTQATGEPLEVEYRIVRVDGGERWLNTQGRCIFDADGRPVRFPGVSFDVTERRRAEEAARTAADDLRTAHETQSFIYGLAEHQRTLETPGAIMAHTAGALGQRLKLDRVGFYRVAGDHIAFGPSWTSGRLPSLAGGLKMEEMDPLAGTYRRGLSVVMRDTAAEHPGSHVARLSPSSVGVPLFRGGQWVASLYANQATPRDWTAEEVAFVEAVAEIAWDAVERVDAAAALRESEEKFRAIANSIEQMVWSARPDGYHDYYNDRWYEYTGAADASTDGAGWNDMVHPDDQDRARTLWHHCLATGEPYHIEYRLRRRSGDYRWVLGRAHPVRDEMGRIIRWFGTCTDIQEIVDAREVLARSREELERAVEERTRQLMAAEAQLRQAQKMEAVGQLTGGIAHDFNNMLAVVLGALDLLERRIAQGNTDLDRYITAARDGATRAAALTQRLLSFARQQPIAPVPIDANAMVEGMIDLLVRTLGEGITVETRLPQDLWTAMADPHQLENVVLNLSVNARDAMPAGGLLRIETGNAAITPEEARSYEIEPGDYVRIAVIDSGSGMSPEVLARAFDPFFTTKGVGKGTGLGLSQVFGFVRQSGGHVRIDTAPGQGTAVNVYFPRHAGTVAAPRSPRPRGEAPRARQGETVLVVEDEERVRSFSVEALRELGYAVIAARDGREALRMVDKGQHAQLLFTDVVMPEMTGRELAERMRERLPGVRVLYTSGYTAEALGDADGALLAKPFDLEDLARHVRVALDS